MRKNDRLLKESAVVLAVQKELIKMGYEPFEERVMGIYDAIDNVSKVCIMEEYDALCEKANKGGWIPCSERLPEDDRKQYIVQKTNGLIDIIGFTKDAYKLDKYDFKEYKGKKKQLFFDYDVEYGYIEYECEAWMPLPEPYKGE